MNHKPTTCLLNPHIKQIPVAPRRFVQATVESVCNSVSCLQYGQYGYHGEDSQSCERHK
jgi:hypothetical protein